MKNNWVIKTQNGYFDGLSGGATLDKAKRYSRREASVLNRIIMCGRAKIVYIKPT